MKYYKSKGDIMNLNKVKITDSISLSTIHTDKFKSGLLTFTLPLPASAESAAYAMLLIGILKRGTEKYPDIASLNRRLDELYASSLEIRSSRVGKNLVLILTSDMLDNTYIPDETDVLDGVLELMAETLLRPVLENGVFPESVFLQEKRFLIDSINSTVNNTRAYATMRLSEMMFANDPEFSTMEELKEILDGISNVDMTDYLKRTVLCAPIEAFYIGSMDESFISEHIARHFGSWNAKNTPDVIPPYAEPTCEYKSITEKMPVSQGKLAMGFKTGVTASKDKKAHYAGLLLNEIFGSSPASKLFMNVREKMSLCYYCSSGYNQYTGTMMVSCGIENKNRDLAEKAILKELDDIKKGKISDVEFTAARTSLENSYNQLYDNPYDIQSFFGNRSLFGFTDDIESSRLDMLRVTKDDVVRLANELVYDSVFFVEGTATDGEEDDYE